MTQKGREEKKSGHYLGSQRRPSTTSAADPTGFTSLSVLIGVVGVLLGFPIVDPIVGIGISIAILFIVKDAAKAIWIRLIDGIEPDILSEIENAPTHVNGVLAVHDVRACWVGHKVYTDVAISVDPQISVRAADVFVTEVEQALREHVRLLGYAAVRVSPATTTTRAGGYGLPATEWTAD
jgi:divalent metal cation (Fe/Co/Zn/Cd) transporter